MFSHAGQALSRIRVVYRALASIGPAATFQLIRRQIGALLGQDARTLYRINVPGYPHPVVIRGGSGSDGFAFHQILVMKDYEMLADLGSPSLIIDGGANIGLASVYFLNRYPALRVVAVEPDPENFEICRMNLEPFGSRATLVKGALWSSCGRLVLVKEELAWNSHVEQAEAGAAASVESFDIPKLISMGGGGTVDLLKVDIEGSEKEVFGTNSDAWLSSVRNIVIEFHGDECEKAFFGALASYKYDRMPFRTVTICQNLRPLAS